MCAQMLQEEKGKSTSKAQMSQLAWGGYVSAFASRGITQLKSYEFERETKVPARYMRRLVVNGVFEASQEKDDRFKQSDYVTIYTLHPVLAKNPDRLKEINYGPLKMMVARMKKMLTDSEDLSQSEKQMPSL